MEFVFDIIKHEPNKTNWYKDEPDTNTRPTKTSNNNKQTNKQTNKQKQTKQKTKANPGAPKE